ncbi:hypothetical protein D3C79_701100 [compost metagenome]
MVEDARVVLEGAEFFRDFRRAAAADHHRAGAAAVFAALGVARDQAQVLDTASLHLRFDAQYLLAIHRLGGEVFGGPAQVVVVLQAAGVEGAEVDEVGQALLLVQVVDETVGAGGVAQRDQILEEGYLQLALGRQRFTMPAVLLLLVDEQRVEGAALGVGEFLQGDGQGQVGRAKAHADQILDGFRV